MLMLIIALLIVAGIACYLARDNNRLNTENNLLLDQLCCATMTDIQMPSYDVEHWPVGQVWSGEGSSLEEVNAQVIALGLPPFPEFEEPR